MVSLKHVMNNATCIKTKYLLSPTFRLARPARASSARSITCLSASHYKQDQQTASGYSRSGLSMTRFGNARRSDGRTETKETGRNSTPLRIISAESFSSRSRILCFSLKRGAACLSSPPATLTRLESETTGDTRRYS